MTTKTLQEENQELVDKFFKLINYMGNDKDLVKAFGDALVCEHRTLQQNTMRFIAEVIKYYGENHRGYDARNEASISWSKTVTSNCSHFFPFI